MISVLQIQQRMTQSSSGPKQIEFRYEIIRKSIHINSLLIPIIYYFIPLVYAASILGGLVAVAFAIEFFRLRPGKFQKWYYNFFGVILREHEKGEDSKSISGATYILLGALLTILIFPKIIAINALAIVVISDLSAALIGKRFGRHPFLKKSLEGTAAFFVTALIVIAVTPNLTNSPVEYLIGGAAALLAAIAENISEGIIDDNIAIPFTVGIVMWVLFAVLFPDLSLELPNVPR